MSGRTLHLHGGYDFDMPVISHIKHNLWLGGVPYARTGDKSLGSDFPYVVSLYPLEKWEIGAGVERREWMMYDNASVDEQMVLDAAAHLNSRLDTGEPVLVHCQAGLNRSALVAACALMMRGMTADEAIALLRERRSVAVLCNRTFEAWLRGQTWA